MEITHISEQNIDSFSPLLPKAKMAGETLLLGSIEEDEACGVLVAEILENVIAIRMIHTAQRFTNKGVATKLVGSLCEIAAQLNMDAVYATFPTTPVLEHIMEISGFEKVEDGIERFYSFDFTALDMAKVSQMHYDKKTVIPLKNLSPNVSNKVKSSLFSLFDKRCDAGRVSEAFDPLLSAVYLEGEEVKGYLLCEKEKDTIQVRYLANLTKSKQVTISLLKYFYDSVKENVDNAPECKVRFKTFDSSIVSFMKMMVTEKIWEEDEVETWYFFPPIIQE